MSLGKFKTLDSIAIAGKRVLVRVDINVPIAMDDKDFQNEADFLFFGNPDVSIPPNSAATLWTFFSQF